MKSKRQFTYKKFIVVLLALSFLSFSCGGGGNQQPKDIVLQFWDPFENTENFQPFFDDFQQKYPNIRIEYTKKDIATYNEDLLNALAAGTGPDIFSINNSWLPKYSDKLTPAPQKIWQFKDYKDAFVDTAVNDFTQEQNIYAVPLYVDSLALYYNKDILGTNSIATPPKTWGELAQDAQKIRRGDRTGYFTVSGLAAGTNSNVNRAMDIVYLFMLQKGAVPYSEDRTRPTFAQPIDRDGKNLNPGQEALSFYTSFANPNGPNYNWNLRSDYSIDAFTNGRAAFLYSYSYTIDTLRKKNPNLNFDVAGAPQPALDQPAVNFANYWGEAVGKQSKNQDAAWSFLKFISSKDSLDKYYVRHKLPASRKDLIALQISDPDIGVFANSNLTAKSFYKPDPDKLDDIFGSMIDGVILKGLSIRDALTQAEQQAETLSAH